MPSFNHPVLRVDHESYERLRLSPAKPVEYEGKKAYIMATYYRGRVSATFLVIEQ